MISSELTCSPNHLGMLDISVDETGDKKKHLVLEKRGKDHIRLRKVTGKCQRLDISSYYLIMTHYKYFQKLSLKSQRQSFDSVRQLMY